MPPARRDCGISSVRCRCAYSTSPTAVANDGLLTWSASPPTPAGHAAADRQVEDLLGDLRHALEDRAAAGQHDAGVERLLVARAPDLVPHQVEDLLGARLQDLGEDRAAPSRAAAGRRRSPPPSSRRRRPSPTSAQPQRRLSFSASGIGVRRPTAMSLVKWSPPTPTTAVCQRLPRSKIARSVVPPPMSTSATPSSFSSGVSTASLAASCSSTVSATLDAGAVHAGDDVLRRRSRCR